jgi:capsular exopolysaccharide synthesis family protein
MDEPKQKETPAGQGGTTTNGENGDEGGFDLHRYWSVVVRRKWLGLGLLVFSLGAAIVITKKSTPIYHAEATIEIDKQPPEVLGDNVKEVVQMGTGPDWSDIDYYETQYKILKSHDVALRATQALSLDRNSDFCRMLGIAPGQLSQDQIADTLSGMVIVEPVKDSMLVTVAVEGPDPKVATLLANGVADAYAARNLDLHLVDTKTAEDKLQTQAGDLKQKFDDSEQQLYQFKKDNDILSVSLSDHENMLAKQIEQTTDELTSVRDQRLELQAERAQLLADKDKDPLAESDVELAETSIFKQSGGVIQDLKKSYLDESATLAALEGKYGEKMPAVVAQQHKVDGIKADLQRETDNLIQAVDNQYQELQSTEKTLQGELATLTSQALDLGEKAIQYGQLNRTYKNNRHLYLLVTGRFMESGLFEQLDQNNVSVLDHAELPTSPVRPSLRLNLAIGLLAGLMVALGAVFTIEYLDRTVKSHIDLEERIGLTFLGLLPRFDEPSGTKLDLFVHNNPKSAAAEACRSIRTNVLFASADREKRSLLVTSAGPSEGKTLTAISVAVAMAQGGNKTLLIDTDMRRPRLHRALGVPSDRGLSNAIIGDTPVADCIRQTDVKGLYVLPCGAIPPNPAELLQSDRFKKVYDEAAARFDTIILDSPPIIAVTDSVILSRVVDGTLLVARAGQTHRGVLARAKLQITRVGGRIFGCVLNDVVMNRRGYGTEYYYYYNRYGYQNTETNEKASGA